MARFLGIDIGASHVRAVVVATAYRRLAVEQLREATVEAAGSVEEAIKAAAGPLLAGIDGIGVAVPGDGAFAHRITLPPAATKQLEEVLTFELEAQVPVDIDELIWNYRVLRRASSQDPLTVLTGAARTERVREAIELVKGALGREPERVGFGPMVLANLVAICPDLRGPGVYALVDLGARRTEVVLLAHGEPVFARTLSRGVADLPDGAPKLAAELRQTFLAWDAQPGDDIQCAYLLGGGSAAHGAEAYFSHQLGVPVQLLPKLAIELPKAPEPTLVSEQQEIPRYAKALCLALGVGGREHDIDLRRGPLAFQRGFGFLKEKMPLLAGLGGAVLLSFVFAGWAELHALSKESVTLVAELESATKAAFDKPVTDVEEAAVLIEQAKSSAESDPMPHMDAFDAMVELAKSVSVTHDVDEFDMQRGHIKINGVVATTEDASVVQSKISEHRCVSGAKIGKISQVVGGTKQKYVLEYDLKCPEDSGAAKKKKAEGDKPEEKSEGDKEGTP
ncbi:MAG TPA: pilus assembly protein PilM [Polyangiaceae bacterium]|nr:pilus assembly protein PilM [Polyangiaceae bacterium]